MRWLSLALGGVSWLRVGAVVAALAAVGGVYGYVRLQAYQIEALRANQAVFEVANKRLYAVGHALRNDLALQDRLASRARAARDKLARELATLRAETPAESDTCSAFLDSSYSVCPGRSDWLRREPSGSPAD